MTEKRHDPVAEAIEQLRFLVACRCNDAYTGRGMHEPNNIHEYSEDVETIVAELDLLRPLVVRLGHLVKDRDERIACLEDELGEVTA